MQRTAVATAILIAGLAVAAPAQAQPPSRVRLLVDGSVQLTPSSFGQAFTVKKNLEDTAITTDLTLGRGTAFDAGVRIRVAGAVSVGVVGFLASNTADGRVNAAIPHPLYFNQPRSVSGELAGLDRTDTGAHIELDYTLPLSKKLDLTLFGGPSYFSTEQALVNDVTYTDSYPFDVATFVAAPTVTIKKSGTGFNVGADVMWRLGRSFGIAALARYATATIPLSVATGNAVDVNAGGLQAGGGLRVMF